LYRFIICHNAISLAEFYEKVNVTIEKIEKWSEKMWLMNTVETDRNSVSAETTQKCGFGLVSVTAKRNGRITVLAET